MRKNTLFLITLMLAGCLASCSAPPSIKEFKSETGGFAVMSPAPLQESVQPLETKGSKIDLHLFSAQQDEIAYFVAYCEYAPDLAKPDNAEKMLDGARDGSVSNTQGKLTSETKITLAGHPGREVVVEARGEDRPAVTIKGRLFMVKNRLYQVTVVAPRARAGDKAVDDFLQSFKLLGQ
ncbi:MAG: hypothetical protein ACHQ2F_13355 [Desulfobaccales bacterium]